MIAFVAISVFLYSRVTAYAVEGDEAYAILDDNYTLTFYFDGERENRKSGAIADYDVPDNASAGDMIPWKNDMNNYVTVQNVVFDYSFKNFEQLKSTYGWFHTTKDTVIKSISGMGNINTSNLANISLMFANLRKVETIDFGDFKASNVVNFGKLFSECKNLKSIDLSGLDTSKAQSMESMFLSCTSLTELDVSNFDTSQVTNMSGMFSGCSGLSGLDVSNFVTTNVTDMSNMFRGCTNITTIDVSNFDTSKVSTMNSMFLSCSGITELDLTEFVTTENLDIHWMFAGCSSLKSVYVSNKWDYEKCKVDTSVFDSCSSLVGGHGTAFEKNAKDSSYAKIDGGASNPGYFSSLVVVKADNVSKYCNEKDNLTVTTTGLYSGDAISFELNRPEGEMVGDYSVTPFGEEYQTGSVLNGKYKVIYQDGMLTIKHKDIVTVNRKEPNYTEAGFLECNKCETCGQYFTDEKGFEIIGDENAYKKWIAEGGKGHLRKLECTHNGLTTGTCPICKEFLGSGDIDLVVAGDVPSDVRIDDIEETVGMSQTEIEAMVSGDEFETVLEVNETTAEVETVEKVTEVLANENVTNTFYVDISLLLKNVTKSENRPVTETKQGLAVTVNVPDELVANSEDFGIVRAHDGVVEILPSTYDATKKRITFITDKFSIYVIYGKTANEGGDYLDPLRECLRNLISINASGDTVVWQAGDSLPYDVMQLIKQSDVTVEFKYTYENVSYDVFINKDNVPEECVVWYGPLYLAGLPKNGLVKEEGIHGEYVVIKDDTLNMLSERFHTTVDELMRLNPFIKDSHWIFPGQVIKY